MICLFFSYLLCNGIHNKNAIIPVIAPNPISRNVRYAITKT